MLFVFQVKRGLVACMQEMKIGAKEEPQDERKYEIHGPETKGKSNEASPRNECHGTEANEEPHEPSPRNECHGTEAKEEPNEAIPKVGARQGIGEDDVVNSI